MNAASPQGEDCPPPPAPTPLRAIHHSISRSLLDGAPWNPLSENMHNFLAQPFSAFTGVWMEKSMSYLFSIFFNSAKEYCFPCKFVPQHVCKFCSFERIFLCIYHVVLTLSSLWQKSLFCCFGITYNTKYSRR